MWYPNNFLRVMLLARTPSSWCVSLGKGYTPKSKDLQDLNDELLYTETFLSAGGTLSDSYQWFDANGGQYAHNFTCVGSNPELGTAKESAIFFRGWIYQPDGSLKREQICLFHKHHNADEEVIIDKSLNLWVYRVVNSMVRFVTPDDQPLYATFGMNDTTANVFETMKLRAKLVAGTAGVAPTIASADIEWVEENTFRLASTVVHEGTSGQLANYDRYEYGQNWTLPEVPQTFKFNKDGTVSFKVTIPFSTRTVANYAAARFWFSISNLRMDILTEGITDTNYPTGNGEGTQVASRWNTRAGSRESLTFEFTLGVPEPVYEKTPSKIQAISSYPTQFRPARSLYFLQTPEGAWTSLHPYSGQTWYNHKLIATDRFLAQSQHWHFSYERSTANYVEIKHVETGVSVVNERELGATHAFCNMPLPINYTVAGLFYSDTYGYSNLFGINREMQVTNAVTQSQLVPTKHRLNDPKASIQVKENGEWVPVQDGVPYRTQSGSVTFNGEDYSYRSDAVTSAYDGVRDRFYYRVGDSVKHVLHPVVRTLPKQTRKRINKEVILKLKQMETTSAFSLIPASTNLTSGETVITVPVGSEYDYTMKNNRTYSARVEIYDEQDRLVEGVTLGASVLPSAIHKFKSLSAGKYTIRYNSIGQEFESDKRPYITPVTQVRRYLDRFTVEGANRTFTMNLYPEGTSPQSHLIRVRTINQAYAPDFKDTTRTSKWNVRGGQFTLVSDGTFGFTATTGNQITELTVTQESGVIYDLINKTTGDTETRHVKVVVSGDRYLPKTIDRVSMQVPDLPNGILTDLTPIQLSAKTYPEGRFEGKVKWYVVCGNATISEDGLLTPLDLEKDIGVIVSVNGQGDQWLFQVNRPKLKPSDVTVNDFVLSRNKAQTLTVDVKHPTIRPEKVEFRLAKPYFGVTLTSMTNQLTVTSEELTTIDVVAYIEGVWVNHTYKVEQQLRDITISTTPVADSTATPIHPGNKVKLNYTLLPATHKDDGSGTWRQYSGVATPLIDGYVYVLPTATNNSRLYYEFSYQGVKRTMSFLITNKPAGATPRIDMPDTLQDGRSQMGAVKYSNQT